VTAGEGEPVPPSPRVGPRVPRAHGRAASALGALMMRVRGWTFEGSVPDLPKMVLIVAPHTSNWDFLTGLWAKLALRLKVSFLGKHTLFWWPLGPFLRSIGGIPIDRAHAQGVAEEAVRAMREGERMLLVVAPEGTRSKTERWKSGFYRIAVAAGVPILLVAFDYGRKVVRLGPLFHPTGDYEKDLAEIQSHYHAGMALRPERY
jgi:1-acyl-sn-glycerol-3-phosphate acyltransferase